MPPLSERLVKKYLYGKLLFILVRNVCDCAVFQYLFAFDYLVVVVHVLHDFAFLELFDVEVWQVEIRAQKKR